MGRRSNRKFETQEYYRALIKDYIKSHKQYIINNMMQKTGYDDMDKLQDDEYHMRFGLDCGWIVLIPKNTEMYKEWKKYEDYEGMICPTAYNTQSITLQEPQVKLILEELNIADLFYIRERLD